MTVVSFDQSVVDLHIHRIVRSAWRDGDVLRVSAVTKRVRMIRPNAIIHQSYVLDRLVKAAAKRGVAIEVDIPAGADAADHASAR
jgi:hypothetical protein